MSWAHIVHSMPQVAPRPARIGRYLVGNRWWTGQVQPTASRPPPCLSPHPFCLCLYVSHVIAPGRRPSSHPFRSHAGARKPAGGCWLPWAALDTMGRDLASRMACSQCPVGLSGRWAGCKVDRGEGIEEVGAGAIARRHPSRDCAGCPWPLLQCARASHGSGATGCVLPVYIPGPRGHGLPCPRDRGLPCPPSRPRAPTPWRATRRPLRDRQTGYLCTCPRITPSFPGKC